MSEIRVGRVEEEIRRIVSDIISNDLKNPNIKGIISVTSVRVSNDLKYANLYVSIYDKKDDSEEVVNDVLKTLNKSRGFIRSELAKQINLRYVPEIKFLLDNSISYGAHIDELLNQISTELNENKE